MKKIDPWEYNDNDNLMEMITTFYTHIQNTIYFHVFMKLKMLYNKL
jgi:hypothetical protein